MASAAPDPRAEMLREVQALIRANNLPGATAKALAALDAGVEHPMLLNLRALKAEEEGRAADALPDLQRARALAPTDFTVVNALGLCFARLERYGEASAAFDAAIKLEPRFAPAYHNKAWVSEMGGDLATARANHELALKMNPAFAEASAALAMMDVRAGDFAAARPRAERILERDKNQATAQVALAACEVEAGDYAVAETRMRLLLAGETRRILPQVLVTARGLWADALHGMGRSHEAFAAYVAEKAEMEALHGARFKDRPRILDFIAWAQAHFDAAEPWPTIAAGTSPARRHVFVVGFPGAGTELLAGAFAAGGEAAVLTDRNPLAGAFKAWLVDAEAVGRLAVAGEAELERQRQAYWAQVRAAGLEPEGRVMVDASPLNLLRLPLIDRLFPEALVLVVRRDPRDVAIELLRRHARLTAMTYEMLTPQGAARMQDAALDLAEAYAARLPIRQILVRYEDLVGDAEAVAEGLTERAGARAAPVTAEAGRGPGQWKLYEEELKPLLPLLRPWMAHFGYPEA